MSYRFSLGVVAVLIFLTRLSPAQINVLTYHNDAGRTGQNTQETLLTAALLQSGKFGRLFSQPVDGQIYAQPLLVTGVSVNGVAHDIVYAATEHDTVYAFDALTNRGSNAGLLWKATFVNPAMGVNTVSAANDVSCLDIAPEIGISATPVIDLASQTLYVVSKTNENGTFYQRLHALDLTSGAEKFGGPVEIQAAFFGTAADSVNGLVTFNPLSENARPGLLLQDGAVYIAWASHCDHDPYHGWVMAYDSQTLHQLGVWNSTPNGSRGGVWQCGAGLAGDGSSVFVSTGNGTTDVVNAFGNAIIRLALNRGSSQIVERDQFTAFNEASLNENDADISSGGVLLLPTRNLAIAGGKEGRIYLLDRSNLGGFNETADQIVQELPGAVGPIFGMEAYWNNYVYFGGLHDSLKAFSFDAGGDGLLSMQPVSQTMQTFAFPGPSASVSSNGISDGIAWILDATAWSSGGAAVLHAYDATNLTAELWNSNQRDAVDNPGPAIKYSLPTIANGHVYVGTGTQLSIYGEMPSGTPKANCPETSRRAATEQACPETRQ